MIRKLDDDDKLAATRNKHFVSRYGRIWQDTDASKYGVTSFAQCLFAANILSVGDACRLLAFTHST
eukprot:scaffold1043_cov271-Chaetoceros_neogracile.AAC.2